MYFITCTVQKWYYIFDRHNRFQILADSLMFCQRQKGLELFAYVFMLNHIHLLVRAPDMVRFLCDFKKFTAREMLTDISAKEPTVVELFPQEGGRRKFWQETNFSEVIDSEKLYAQKLNYIHDNPVRKQYVERQEHWKWSSANPDQPISLSLPW